MTTPFYRKVADAAEFSLASDQSSQKTDLFNRWLGILEQKISRRENESRDKIQKIADLKEAGQDVAPLIEALEEDLAQFEFLRGRLDKVIATNGSDPFLPQIEEKIARVEAGQARAQTILDQNALPAPEAPGLPEAPQAPEAVPDPAPEDDAPQEPNTPPQAEAPEEPVNEAPSAPETPPAPEPPSQETPAVEPPVEEPAPAAPPPPTYQADDFDGTGQVVVIIDSGWSAQFVSENDRPIAQYDFSSDDGDAQVFGDNLHGSLVDEVLRGQANGVQTIHLKVSNDEGAGISVGTLEDAFQWVIDAEQSGAFDISVVNLSISGQSETSAVTTFLSDEYAALNQAGVVTTVSAGNEGLYGVNFIAANDDVIAVSASTADGDIADFSQRHDELTDIFAWGDDVLISDEDGALYEGNGTSFAAPYVAAVAARVQQAAETTIGRELTPGEFLDVLQASGDDLNGYADDADPRGYHIANGDAAVQYFLDNQSDYLLFS